MITKTSCQRPLELRNPDPLRVWKCGAVLRKGRSEATGSDLSKQQQQMLGVMQQSLSDLKETTIRNKIEADDLVRDFKNKQQHDLELIQKSLLDLKQSAESNRIESDDLASDFKNKQQQDIELIKQSLLDLKQCAASRRAESDVQARDFSSLEYEHEPMNRTSEREDKEIQRRKKRLVRDNEPNDWNAPL